MSKKILLVEDEALIAMNEAQMLQHHGYEVVTAYNGEKAIKDVDSDPDISLILMDIDLGKGMDGTAASEKILSRHELPIVFLTSHSEKEYVDMVKKITAYGYVLKNSGKFVLIESIQMAFELFDAHKKLKKENSARRETEEELSSIYTHTPVLMLLVDKERRVRKANAFAAEFAGTPAEEMIGKRGGEALRCIHHLDDPQGCGFGPFCKECTVKRAVGNIFANGKEYQRAEATLPFLQQGEEQQLTFLVSTSLLHKKEEDLCLVAFEDITDYKQLQEKYTGLFENAPLPYQSLDAQGHFLEINSAWLDALGGYTREEVLGTSFGDFLHPDSMEDFRDNLEKLKKSGAAKENIYKMKKKNGEYIVASFNGRIAYTSGGKVKQTHCILKDVTERKRAEEKLRKALKEKDFLMQELNHRVKNNLLMVTSLISLKDSETADDLSDIQQQIGAISLIHEKLYQADSITEIGCRDYIGDLLNSIFSSFSRRPVRIEADIDEISIPAKSAMPLGLIVNEIATNAIKHGFNEKEEAVFSIKMEQDKENNQYTLTLSNSGNPFPADIDVDNPQTLGLRLISTLTGQLGGTIDLKRAPRPVFIIRFPVEEE